MAERFGASSEDSPYVGIPTSAISSQTFFDRCKKPLDALVRLLLGRPAEGLLHERTEVALSSNLDALQDPAGTNE